MKRAAIYTRISDDREGKALGVERQESDARALAARLGLEVVATYSDNDISASTRTRAVRPDYRRLLADAAANRFDVVLAATSSRITRKPREFEDLIELAEQHGIRFEYDKSPRFDLNTADGRMLARMLSAADAAEAERISERTRRAKLQARIDGKWHGGWRAYGMTDGNTKVVPKEAKILKEMTGALLDGRSVISLVRDLNERKVPTSTGGAWTPRSLCRVLRRPHPSIPDDVTEAVALLLGDPARRTSPGPERRWLLSGIARCGTCNGPLTGSGSSLGAGRGTYPAYRCKTGRHTVVSAITLDEYITTVTVGALTHSDFASLFAAPDIDTTELRREAVQRRAQLDALADNIDLDERTLARRGARLRERLDEIQAELAAAVTTGPLAAFAGADPVDVWLGLDLERRRNVVDALMTITINRGARGVVASEHRWRKDLPAFDPRRVNIDWKVAS